MLYVIVLFDMTRQNMNKPLDIVCVIWYDQSCTVSLYIIRYSTTVRLHKKRSDILKKFCEICGISICKKNVNSLAIFSVMMYNISCVTATDASVQQTYHDMR